MTWSLCCTWAEGGGQDHTHQEPGQGGARWTVQLGLQRGPRMPRGGVHFQDPWGVGGEVGVSPIPHRSPKVDLGRGWCGSI